MSALVDASGQAINCFISVGWRDFTILSCANAQLRLSVKSRALVKISAKSKPLARFGRKFAVFPISFSHKDSPAECRQCGY